MRTLRPQSGISLISLLVGLVISLIVSLAMLMAFKNVVRTSGDSLASSHTNEQTTAALLRASISLQDAGYGIDTPQSPRDLLVLHATLDKTTQRLTGSVVTNGAGNAVVWSLRPDTASLQCAGLIYDDATDGTGGLKYLPQQPCTTDAQSSWQTLTWTPSVWVDLPANPSNVSWTLAQATCRPFGIPATEGRLTLTLSAHDASGASLTDTLCLSNFQ